MTEKPIFNQITIRNTHNSPIKKFALSRSAVGGGRSSKSSCRRGTSSGVRQVADFFLQRCSLLARTHAVRKSTSWIRLRFPRRNNAQMPKDANTSSTTTVGKEKVCKTRGWCRWCGSCPTASGSNDSLRVSCRPWFTFFLHLTQFFGRWSQADLRQR